MLCEQHNLYGLQQAVTVALSEKVVMLLSTAML